MAFDPDKYLAMNEEIFNPDEYLTQAAKEDSPKPEATQPEEGEAQAFLEHYGNTATLGYLPHLQAAVTKMLPNPNAELDEKLRSEGFTIKEDGPKYTDLRDQNIERLQRESANHPKASGAGTVAGIAASTLLAGKLIPASAPATLTGRLGHAAATGAALGGIANPGDVKGELSPVQLGDRLKNASISGALGAAGQGVAEGISAAAAPVGNYLRSKANEKAFKATGAMLKDFRKAHGRDKVDEIGRELLDRDIVTTLATPKDVAARTESALTAEGKRIEGILSELDEAQKALNTGGEPGLVPHGVKAPGGVRSGVDRKAIAKAMREELLNPNADLPGIAQKNAKISALIDQFEQGGDDMLGLLEAELKKRSIGKEINWKRLPDADIPIEEQVQRSLYTKLKQGVEDGAEALEDMAGGPNAGRFKDAKNSYGNLETANKIATDRVSRDSANRAFGLTDTIAGAGLGAASGDSPEEKAAYAVVFGLLNKAGRTYGNPVQAKSYDALSKLAFKSPALSAAVKKNPVAFQTLMEGIQSKARGGPDYGSGQAHPLFKDARALEILRKNPALIDSIQDERLKRELRKHLERGPAQAPSQRLQSEESARQQYMENS